MLNKPFSFLLTALVGATFSLSTMAASESLNLDDMPERTDSAKTQYIEHPLEAKGLVRITSDKTYIYKTEEAKSSHAAALRFAPYEPTNLSNPDTGTSFRQNYDSSSGFPMILFDYDWKLWRSALGRMDLKVGSGLYSASGHGRFKNQQENPNQQVPLESFTFFMFPNFVGLNYRFQLSDRPWFIPYVEGGGHLFAFTEIRDDSKTPKFGGAFGAYGVAGGALNLKFIDARSAWALDREYGVSSVYLTGEARVIASTTKYDFSSTTFAVGFLFDF